MNTNILGIFDSGLGGLTVVCSLVEHMPHQSFIYIGDNAHRPYGAKSSEEIAHFSIEIGKYLQARGVDMIVVACNTASSAALEKLRASVDIPVIGIIDAGVQAALNEAKKLNLLPSCENTTGDLAQKFSLKIGVLATVSTVQSAVYKRKIEEVCPQIEVIQQAAPRLEEIVETQIFQDTSACNPTSWIDSDKQVSQEQQSSDIYHNDSTRDGDEKGDKSKKRFIYGRYFSQEEIDTFKKDILQVVEPLIKERVSFIVLGCTHFPIMADLIQEVIRENNNGVSIPLVDPAAYEVQEVEHYIQHHPELKNTCNEKKALDQKTLDHLSSRDNSSQQIQEFLTTEHNVPKFRACIRNILKEENPSVHYVSIGNSGNNDSTANA